MTVSRRLMKRFSILNSGMPYRSRPPMRSDFSKTVTVWPARLSWSAAASPAGPDPMTATDLPVRTAGGAGAIHPSSKACSTMASSTDLMVTASPSIASTQDPSHGAGQSRPVHSGKLLVLCSRSIALRHLPR